MRKTRFGWFELIVGILTIALGIFTLVQPDSMATGLIRIYGVIAVISGIKDIMFSCRSGRFVGFVPYISLSAGIISMLSGIFLIAYPGAGKWIMSLLIPIWLIAHSIFQLSTFKLLRQLTTPLYYYTCTILSIIGLVIGILMLIYPVLTLIAATTLVGIYLILAGVNSIILAFSKSSLE